MKNKFYYLAVILSIAIFLIITVGCTWTATETPDGALAEREALTLGTKVLKEKYPEEFKSSDLKVEIEDRGHIWYVYSYDPEPIKVLPDGSMMVMQGGGLAVEIDKMTGNVLRVLVKD